jgi:hypothetical protein
MSAGLPNGSRYHPGDSPASTAVAAVPRNEPPSFAERQLTRDVHRSSREIIERTWGRSATDGGRAMRDNREVDSGELRA